MQSLGRRTPAQLEALRAARQFHHDRHLMFGKKVYLRQVHGGRHAHIEQPKYALSWQTRALRDLPGRRADFDQCRYGSMCLDTDNVWRPARKSASILTTKQAVQNAMTLHGHRQLTQVAHFSEAGCLSHRSEAASQSWPSCAAPKELEELLAARGASDQVLEAARTYVCVACAKYKKPADAAPAAMSTTATFNQTVWGMSFGCVGERPNSL